MSFPVDALLAVTYRCNARCVMCNIWQTPMQDDLSPAEWANMPASLKDINISGGEPFLRDDLPEIVSVVKGKCPGAKLIISTNGIAVKRIERSMERIVHIDPRIGVGISIDGIGEVHDRTRGLKGAYEKAIQTLQVLKKLGIKNLRIAFTAVEDNIDQMKDVYDLSRRLEVEFSCVVAHDSDVYFKTSGLRLNSLGCLKEQLNLVALSELKTFVPKRLLRSYFYSGLYGLVENGKRVLPCLAGEASFFLDPTGELYACNVLNSSMGNIRGEPFAKLWNSQKAAQVREKVANCRKPCWMMCSARSSIKKHPARVGLWILKNKTGIYLGKRSII
ncbi:radical SAM protein [candidate division TA06 bacterium]|uniref:Radical SAM protein n=1 Tax=candidate division TA06 bacterium TaxID=2250710 RepID=A0A523UWK1_UNCT6|nr:MAG: radical SAM protein [candidate division TA06 bacterium]